MKKKDSNETEKEMNNGTIWRWKVAAKVSVLNICIFYWICIRYDVIYCIIHWLYGGFNAYVYTGLRGQ